LWNLRVEVGAGSVSWEPVNEVEAAKRKLAASIVSRVGLKCAAGMKPHHPRTIKKPPASGVIDAGGEVRTFPPQDGPRIGGRRPSIRESDHKRSAAVPAAFTFIPCVTA